MKVPHHIVELAEKICLKSEMRQKMSAIVFDKRGNVINVGYNRRIIKSIVPTTLFKYGQPYISIHAEIDCLAGLTFDDTYGNYMYVHRKNGLIAKPCLKCQHVLDQFGLKRIFYSQVL
jgi:deoxycytidylate deaminase